MCGTFLETEKWKFTRKSEKKVSKSEKNSHFLYFRDRYFFWSKFGDQGNTEKRLLGPFLCRFETETRVSSNSETTINDLARHYLSYTKISQTKCYKQSDTIFQLSFHCSFRCCAPFCSLCFPLSPLLLIGGKLSIANQDPQKNGFKVQHREQNEVHHLKEQ